MNKKMFYILILFILINPVYALQQTTGEIIINTTIANQTIAKYGIRNEENMSVTVKFNVTGNIIDYIDYQKEITLEPKQFKYIEVKADIPSDYKGSSNLNGTIYALKEGSKDGQVQLNIRLGKNIKINIKEQSKSVTSSKIDIPQANGISSSMLIGILLFVIYFMKNRIRTKQNK